MSPQEKARGFLSAGEQLVTGLESLDATARRQLHIKMSFVLVPADVRDVSE